MRAGEHVCDIVGTVLDIYGNKAALPAMSQLRLTLTMGSLAVKRGTMCLMYAHTRMSFHSSQRP